MPRNCGHDDASGDCASAGTVSASHAIVEVGEEETVRIGDEATLVGPDHPDIGPNAVAAATGRSVYDIFMHLDRGLPRVVLPGA